MISIDCENNFGIIIKIDVGLTIPENISGEYYNKALSTIVIKHYFLG